MKVKDDNFKMEFFIIFFFAEERKLSASWWKSQSFEANREAPTAGVEIQDEGDIYC